MKIGKRKMIKRILVVVLLFSIIVLLALFYVWERATAFQLTLVLSKKEKKMEKTMSRVRKLRLEYLNLTSVLRIEKIAKEQLNMRYPSSKEIKYVIEN